jgi:hypothetical protein
VLLGVAARRRVAVLLLVGSGGRYHGSSPIRCTTAIDVQDVPTFRFTCWASNTLQPAATPPPPDPPSPPAHPAACPVPCGKGFTCLDSACCVGLLGVSRPHCQDNKSAYAFVLGGRGGPMGKWYDPHTWVVNTTSVDTRWGNLSAEFTSSMVNATLLGEQAGFYKKFPTLAVQIGVRSSRLDTGVLNITCHFLLTGRDAGRSPIQIRAAVQNTNCTSCRGWTGMHGDDSGGYIGVMLGRDNSTGTPTIQTFADFNRERYWANLAGVPTASKIAKLFPIIDSFQPDGDITTREDAFAAMHDKMLTNMPMGVLPPMWTGRTTGIPWSQAEPGFGAEGVLGVGGEFRKGSDKAYHNQANSEPCYTANSSCTMHDYTMKNATDAGLVNKTDIARAVAATFGSVGIKPGSIVGSAMADEPGWRAPLWVPTDTSSIVRQRWINYLKAKGLTPADLGASEWGSVEPYRAHPDGLKPLPLTERRRFYWSIRFIHWDSCRYMAEWTAALQRGAKDPNFQTFVNWNNFDVSVASIFGRPCDIHSHV